MGCASSKRIEASVDVYRPAPTSFAVFDINAIEEPWLKFNTTVAEEQQEKPSHVPTAIVEKLDSLETTEAPQSWADLSKALDDLKPTLKAPPSASPTKTKPKPPHKSTSFHTLQELDAKLNSKELRKTESARAHESEKDDESMKSEGGEAREAAGEGGGFKAVKDNIFLVRDRIEREKEGREAKYEKIARLRRNPLAEFPEKCPPGGEEAVVVYTTSLGGVRKTFEDCNKVKEILEGERVVYDERDVSFHAEFLKETKELLGEGVRVPRVFVKGRYLGGADELAELNDSGRLGRILRATRVERGVGRQACEGCGGARFVPCLACGGSCKVVGLDGDSKQRCPNCNENGLVHCPACLSL